jgi:hypothetical protein
MKTRTFLAALALWVALPAHAVGRFTDATDLWWSSAEPGWGVNVVQQNEVLFLTFFIYNLSHSSAWYSASEMKFANGNFGVLTYEGALYESRGSTFDDYYDGAALTYRQVGNVQFRMTTQGTATLVYSIDGHTVTKQLTRFTWRVNEVAGAYLGGIAGDYSSCPAAPSNGYGEEGGLRIVVSQSGPNVAIQATGSSATCVYDGRNYDQQGRLGTMSGRYFCTDGTEGSFNATELEANPQGFTVHVTTTTNNCNFSGRIAGARRG